MPNNEKKSCERVIREGQAQHKNKPVILYLSNGLVHFINPGFPVNQ